MEGLCGRYNPDNSFVTHTLTLAGQSSRWWATPSVGVVPTKMPYTLNGFRSTDICDSLTHGNATAAGFWAYPPPTPP